MSATYSPPTDMPTQPVFEPIPSYQTYNKQYQTILAHIVFLSDHGKAGQAINDIITELMPSMQKYNTQYVEGNIANGENAATYALNMTNYIAGKYQDYSNQDTASEGQDAYDAIYAEQTFNQVVTAAGVYGKGNNPFGTMGSGVSTQLQTMTDGIFGVGQGNENADTLAAYWKQSWDMTGTNSPGIAENSEIMEATQGAQNQSQSAAAYLQTEAKIANENVQQDDTSGHDIAQNQISVEKQAVTATQNANS